MLNIQKYRLIKSAKGIEGIPAELAVPYTGGYIGGLSGLAASALIPADEGKDKPRSVKDRILRSLAYTSGGAALGGVAGAAYDHFKNPLKTFVESKEDPLKSLHADKNESRVAMRKWLGNMNDSTETTYMPVKHKDLFGPVFKELVKQDPDLLDSFNSSTGPSLYESTNNILNLNNANNNVGVLMHEFGHKQDLQHANKLITQYRNLPVVNVLPFGIGTESTAWNNAEKLADSMELSPEQKQNLKDEMGRAKNVGMSSYYGAAGGTIGGTYLGNKLTKKLVSGLPPGKVRQILRALGVVAGFGVGNATGANVGLNVGKSLNE